MGSAIGGMLVERGHEVCWRPRGRSMATARRAQEAGLEAVQSFADVELILSICPPHAALDVAGSLRACEALVVDANAVSPATAVRIGSLLGEDRWVDGAIVGPPPYRDGTTRLYLSGARAGEVEEVFAGTRLEVAVLGHSPVAASALKMVYASWSKGAAALLIGACATARAMGVEEPLREEWRRSAPEVEQRLAESAQSAAAKGWRFTGEMREVAATFKDAGLPGGFHEAAAEVFARAAQREDPLLEALIGALLARGDARARP